MSTFEFHLKDRYGNLLDRTTDIRVARWRAADIINKHGYDGPELASVRIRNS